jgi:hypothetical protein
VFTSRPSVVVLSRGSTWNPRPFDPPYTLPDDVVGRAWPDGATAHANFYDNTGAQLVVVDGTVSPGGICFNAGPDVMDQVPNGANFELFITTEYGDPYQIRYGKVVRREAEFLQAPPATVTTPLVFADSWPTLGLRSSWVQMGAKPIVVRDNSGASQPNGVAAGSVLLGSADACMRWYRPLATDSVKVKLNTLDKHSYLIGGYAELYAILCGDQAFSSFLAVQFKGTLGLGHVNTIKFGVGSSPSSFSQQGDAITHTIGNGQYTIGYDDATKLISIYAGTDTAPLGSWEDVGHAVPHGPGFRYLGIRSSISALTDGLQATSWQAIDA